ncbi:ATP-binding protein [Paenibacillus sp. S150]|uniref:ATP-binding protein n=1 Tax=Paenibacillus sp. S150 TaxID=2749826 RepID=UPI001C56C797|nr:ATP-binding protein [Paenibacillus sp. S150]MBW4082413.1 hypothetical protein [Paenibacillus sp. S150]
MKKIVVYGLTGSGKSTSAALIQDYYKLQGKTVETIKLAKPLYDLQLTFYRTAGLDILYDDQDQHLLEDIAVQLRRISKTCLADDFCRRLKEAKSDVVLNDDLRDPYVDYPALLKENFIFIRVICPEELRVRHLASRADKRTILYSKATQDIDLIKPNYVIMNDSMHFEDLQAKILALMEVIN